MKIPVSYLQTDSKWASTVYSTNGSQTIKATGCGPSSMAMVVATLADSSVTPATLCEWSVDHGYCANSSSSTQGTYYTYFVPQGKAYDITVTRVNTSNIYGLSTTTATTSHTTALAAIKAGNWVLCCMGKGNWTSSGHYILWYGLDSDGNVLIRDPNSTKSARTCALLSLLQSQVKYYWIVEVPEGQVQVKFDLSDSTMEYLRAYQYADTLFEKLLAGSKDFSDATIAYLKAYKYGDALISKLGIE